VARLGLAHAATRRGLQWALNAGIIAVGPVWAIGAGLMGWLWINSVIEEMRAASRHFILAADRPALIVCFAIKTEIREPLLKPLIPARMSTELSIDATAPYRFSYNFSSRSCFTSARPALRM
jgi:hypothetical protein